MTKINLILKLFLLLSVIANDVYLMGPRGNIDLSHLRSRRRTGLDEMPDRPLPPHFIDHLRQMDPNSPPPSPPPQPIATPQSLGTPQISRPQQPASPPTPAQTNEKKEPISTEKTEKNDKENPSVPSISNTILKGLIQAPEHIKTLSPIRIFFAGNQTSNNNEGFFSFPIENSNLNKCYFLICNQIIQNFDGVNTIESLSINSIIKHRFFSLKKILLKDDNYKWEWKEKSLGKKNFVIPPNCIVFLIHPKYVEKLDEWKIKLMNQFIALPKIVLKSNVSAKNLNRTSAKSLLYSLNSRLFHQTIKEEKKAFEDKPEVQILLAQ